MLKWRQIIQIFNCLYRWIEGRQSSCICCDFPFAICWSKENNFDFEIYCFSKQIKIYHFFLIHVYVFKLCTILKLKKNPDKSQNSMCNKEFKNSPYRNNLSMGKCSKSCYNQLKHGYKPGSKRCSGWPFI